MTKPLVQRLREETVWEAPAEELMREAADEIERLTSCLKQANANHEQFERLYYLEKQKTERDADEPSARRVTTVAGIECMGMQGRHPSGLDTAPGVLQHCPFCGHVAAFREAEKVGHDRFTISVECSNGACAVRMPQHYASRETAAEAWNRRALNRDERR
jgi:hypothetical protein